MDYFIKSVIAFLLFGTSIVSAQNFDQHFENKILRIDYHHIGDAKSESFEMKSFHAGGEWNGTRAYLTQPFEYGSILFEVYDSVTHELIFKRSYSTLFDEYKATERAEKEIGYFEECVNLPFPKKSIKFTFTSNSRKREATLKYTGYFNPKTTTCQPFVKEHDVMDLHIGGKPDQCLDILFIPDGYTKEEQEKLEKDMQRFADYVLDCSPYNENKKMINIRAVRAFSEESGITDPNKGELKKTLLNSSYNVLDLDRYLMCLNVWKMNAVADDAPYDHVVLICNSTKYGGGGIYNFYCTVNSEHQRSAYVIVHELGHGVGGLGDEYYTSEVSVRDYYPEGIEPVDPNLTTLVDFDTKWADLIESGLPVPTPAVEENRAKVGVYEGGGYVAEGVYRPYISCTMKDAVYNRFCPVCTRVLIETFKYYSNKIKNNEYHKVRPSNSVN
ncbi:MAG: IgA Peptidase M64 [Bacteroidales bacterium]|jgi:hypothetical protein|nr:IgA Peptidase M64 [Bacteroidales bacterium]